MGIRNTLRKFTANNANMGRYVGKPDKKHSRNHHRLGSISLTPIGETMARRVRMFPFPDATVLYDAWVRTDDTNAFDHVMDINFETWGKMEGQAAWDVIHATYPHIFDETRVTNHDYKIDVLYTTEAWRINEINHPTALVLSQCALDAIENGGNNYVITECAANIKRRFGDEARLFSLKCLLSGGDEIVTVWKYKERTAIVSKGGILTWANSAAGY